MPFTNYLDQKLLDQVMQGVTYSVPSPLYVGLSSTQPSQAAGSLAPYWNTTEITGNGYVSDAVTSSISNWIAVLSEPSAGYELQNANILAFPTSTGAWNAAQPIGFFFVKDGPGALNPGVVNLLFYGALIPAESVTISGVTLEFPVGQLTTSLS